ncbi:unnamed protein product [Schistosoma curassoni]|uniref:DUF4102 domain-containing protein n=1 Tax=Schistosoma curassoni TaxID=6186 RepID=A0A183JWY6_9TREM|nr:unnamed protein product [Schistosoma curassoni]
MYISLLNAPAANAMLSDPGLKTKLNSAKTGL